MKHLFIKNCIHDAITLRFFLTILFMFVFCQYIFADVLEPVNDDESWNFFSWLFNSEEEAAWFTCLKWIIFIGIVIYVIKIVLQAWAIMLGVGLIVGAIGLVIGFILKWLDWIESDTMWDIANWGFKIGNGIGLVMSILDFGDLHEGALQSWTSSSSSSRNSSSSTTISDEWGHRHYDVTQDSPNSLTDFTDQHGQKWVKDTQGWHRRGEHKQ